mmetsp:Transcript_51234/g.90487  ORF Transcript_51234/g.90487 Transcript_51234/m.90487 type:complete len:82 (+) Transcript_51234:51-296(+)
MLSEIVTHATALSRSVVTYQAVVHMCSYKLRINTLTHEILRGHVYLTEQPTHRQMHSLANGRIKVSPKCRSILTAPFTGRM